MQLIADGRTVLWRMQVTAEDTPLILLAYDCPLMMLHGRLSPTINTTASEDNY